MKLKIAAAVCSIWVGSVAAQEFKLSDLGSAQVDYLTFGMRALETDLRLKSLESCSTTNCRNTETRYGVGFTTIRPDYFPAGVHWPDGGAIAIALSETRMGTDSSMATEDGCRARLISLRILSKWPEAHMSYARFFLPENDWRSVKSINQDSPIARRMKDLTARMFFVVTQSHEWQKPTGHTDRKAWVSCFGSIAGEDAAIIARGQYPQ